MLCLGRKILEEIVITVPPSDKPTTIVHQTLGIRERQFRHGYTAPREVQILRREVAERQTDVFSPSPGLGSANPPLAISRA